MGHSLPLHTVLPSIGLRCTAFACGRVFINTPECVLTNLLAGAEKKGWRMHVVRDASHTVGGCMLEFRLVIFRGLPLAKYGPMDIFAKIYW